MCFRTGIRIPDFARKWSRSDISLFELEAYWYVSTFLKREKSAGARQPGSLGIPLSPNQRGAPPALPPSPRRPRRRSGPPPPQAVRARRRLVTAPGRRRGAAWPELSSCHSCRVTSQVQDALEPASKPAWCTQAGRPGRRLGVVIVPVLP